MSVCKIDFSDIDHQETTVTVGRGVWVAVGRGVFVGTAVSVAVAVGVAVGTAVSVAVAVWVAVAVAVGFRVGVGSNGRAVGCICVMIISVGKTAVSFSTGRLP